MRRLIVVLALLASACGSTNTVVDRVEVPVPYWDPPKREEIKPLPEPYDPLFWSLDPESAKVDTEVAFETLGEDITNLLAENETLRKLYNDLVEFITTRPEEAQ
jgi:hypothetical protein